MAELILALDLPEAPEAFRLLDRIPEVRWVKVGSILMTREGPDLVRRLVDRGLSVFLDLKWHDIPNTVAASVEAARGLGASMATVHTLGGGEMLEAAARAAGPGLAVVAVTVLTSHSAHGYAEAVGRPEVALREEAVRQGTRAVRAGCAGVVASAHEARVLRAALGPGPLLVVPGIRRPGEPADDQARTATAAEAIEAGATHLVVGRPVLRSPDPAGAWAGLAEVTA